MRLCGYALQASSAHYVWNWFVMTKELFKPIIDILCSMHIYILVLFPTGHCKDCKNFNSLFAIISGLGHGSVSRLHNTWDKIPSKYTKMFEDLQNLMDPSRNMSKYRNLVNAENIQPPLVSGIWIWSGDLLDWICLNIMMSRNDCVLNHVYLKCSNLYVKVLILFEV